MLFKKEMCPTSVSKKEMCPTSVFKKEMCPTSVFQKEMCPTSAKVRFWDKRVLFFSCPKNFQNLGSFFEKKLYTKKKTGHLYFYMCTQKLLSRFLSVSKFDAKFQNLMSSWVSWSKILKLLQVRYFSDFWYTSSLFNM